MIRKSHLVIAAPRLGAATSESKGVVSTLKMEMAQVAYSKLNLTPKFTPGTSESPVIYYEDLFRSGEEISSIRDYYDAYSKLSPAARQNYYVFPGAEHAPEIVSHHDFRRPLVTCGNPGCSADIRRQPNTDLICRKCRKPILNRCGNAGCRETDLAAVIGRLDPGQENLIDGVPPNCPSCGNPLKTYWWECDEPRHKSAPIRTAEDTCPECDNEYRQNRRPLHDVSHFKRDAGLECPGCVNSGLEDDKVFRIPWNLESYFFDGVAPQQAGRFKELLDHSHVPFHVCQNQQRELHYIFPSVRS
jgi:hypothetical protein